MASGESEENEAVRAYFPSFAAHSRACQTKLTNAQAISSMTKSLFPFCAHSHDGAYHTNDQLCNETDPLMSRFGACMNVIHPWSRLVFSEHALRFFIGYLTQLTKLVKTSRNWLPHAQAIFKLLAKVVRCCVELHCGNVFWRNNFDPTSSQGFSQSIFWGKNPGDEADFHPVCRANLKWPIKEATTLHWPNNKRYLKQTIMSRSTIKKVIYLPPVSAASWQRNWLASVSAQLKEMVWMGTGFNSWTWASMDDGGWKGKVKG